MKAYAEWQGENKKKEERKQKPKQKEEVRQ